MTAMSRYGLIDEPTDAGRDETLALQLEELARNGVTAGSIIVFDAMTFHSGGVNLGQMPRRAVNTLFGVPLLAQQVTFTAKPDMDATLRRRLGLDYQPASSADGWRAARLTRLGGA